MSDSCRRAEAVTVQTEGSLTSNCIADAVLGCMGASRRGPAPGTRRRSTQVVPGDLSSGTESRRSRRVKMSTGRADREVDEEREDPELRRRCRRRRPGRATGKHHKKRKGKKRHASGHEENKLRVSTAYTKSFKLRHRFQNGTRAV